MVVAATMAGRVVDVAPRIVVGSAVYVTVAASGRRGADGTPNSRLAAIDITGIVAVWTIVLYPAGVVARRVVAARRTMADIATAVGRTVAIAASVGRRAAVARRTAVTAAAR